MANLLLLTANSGWAAVINTRAGLEAHGHTVTVQQVGDMSAMAQPTGYAALVCVALPYANRAANGAKLRDWQRAGLPFISSVADGGQTASNVDATVAHTGLCNRSAMYTTTSGYQDIDITSISHPITDGFALGRLQVWAAADFYGYVTDATVTTGAQYVGTSLAIADPDNASRAGRHMLIAVEKGTTDLAGVATGARVVISGAIFGHSADYTTSGDLLLHEMVLWATTTAPPPNTAPSQPGALSPASGSTIKGNATISWGASTDAEGNAISYSGRYQLGTGAWVSFGPQAGTSFALPNLADGPLNFEVWASDGSLTSTTRAGSYTIQNNTAPTAGFTASVSLRTVTVTSTATDADGTITTTEYDYGVGLGWATATSYTYASYGTYTITQRVTDNAGATATASQPVTLTDPASGDPNDVTKWTKLWDTGAPWFRKDVNHCSTGAVGSFITSGNPGHNYALLARADIPQARGFAVSGDVLLATSGSDAYFYEYNGARGAIAGVGVGGGTMQARDAFGITAGIQLPSASNQPHPYQPCQSGYPRGEHGALLIVRRVRGDAYRSDAPYSGGYSNLAIVELPAIGIFSPTDSCRAPFNFPVCFNETTKQWDPVEISGVAKGAFRRVELEVTRLNSYQVRVRARTSLQAAGVWPVDVVVGTTLDPYPADLCHSAGFSSWRFPDIAIFTGFRSFRDLSVTPIGDNCAFTAPVAQPFQPAAPPPEPTEPGRPCTLELTVYKPDDVTPDWVVSTDKSWQVPYLSEPQHYGEQVVDFAEGRAKISSAAVRVIDPPLYEGAPQDLGWLTYRLSDAQKSAIAGRRCRLRRYISTAEGWVTIVDGKGGFPRLSESYAAYDWEIRDTRDTERKLRAFTRTTSTVLPRGALNNWGKRADGTYLVTAVAPITGTQEGQRVDFTALWSGTTPPNSLILTQAAWDLGASTKIEFVREEMQVVVPGQPAQLVRIYRHTYGNLELRYRAAGAADPMTVVGDVWVEFVERDWPSNYWTDPKFSDVDPFDGKQAVRTIHIPTDWFPAVVQQSVEVLILTTGGPSEQFPLHIEMAGLQPITAGEFLRDLYDGWYSPRDPVTGAVVPTGIRYDLAALLAMTTPIRARLTAPVDDLRAWTEEHIYAPLGYAPALDSDGRISPVSQAAPTDATVLSGLTSITNQITKAEPGWSAGEQIINALRFTYSRVYSDPNLINGLLEVREVVMEQRNEESVKVHGEQMHEISTDAFTAIGNGSGDAIEAETGARLFAVRRDALFNRLKWGAPIVSVECMRLATYHLRAGSWVRLRLSWMPRYSTRRRNMDHLAQVISVADLNCSWRRFVFQVVREW